MKIWLLTSEFPPDFGGGIATYCVQYARALVAEGHEVTVFARVLSAGRPQQRDGYRVIPVHLDPNSELTGVSDSWHYFSLCLSAAVLGQLATEATPDEIEFQDYGGIGYYLTKQKLLGEPLLAGVRLTVFCHTPVFELQGVNEDPAYRFPEYWLGRMEKFCLLGADAVYAPSHFMAQRLQRFTDKPITVLHLPFELGKVSERRAPKTTDLLFVGRAEYRKGLLQLLEGMRQVWDAGYEVRLRTIGGDTVWGVRGTNIKSIVRSKYQAYIEKGLLRLDDPMEPAQLAAELGAAKAIVVPSLYENFPYVCIEALASGTPVIGSRAGGHAELIGEDAACGLLFDVADAASIARAVVSIVAKSSQELAAMGQAGRLRVDQMCEPKAFVAARMAGIRRTLPVRGYPFVNDREGFASKAAPAGSDEERAELLSVVVPYFNMGDYIDETLGSIFASTYRDIEVVIVNDGSTQPSAIAALERIGAGRHAFPVRIIDTANGGLARARNVGAAAAQGEFLAFLDADDLVDPAYYARCVDVLQRYDNVSFVYSWVRYFGENTGIWINFDTDFPYFLCANMLAAFLVARRSAVRAAGSNRQEMSYGMEDYDAWLRMAAQGYRGVSIPQFLSHYRIRSNSMTRQMGSGTVLRMYELLVRGNSEVFQRWGPQVAQLLYANGPGRLWNTPSRSYPPLTYGVISTDNPAIRSLASTISEGDKQAVLRILSDPVIIRIGKLLLRSRLHVPVLIAARGVGHVARRFRRRRAPRG